MFVRCPGCNRRVRSNGLTNHIQQTTDPICIEYHQNLANTYSMRTERAPSPSSPPPVRPLVSPESIPVDDPSDPRNEAPIPTDPGGDFFGDYMGVDFPGIVDDDAVVGSEAHPSAMDVDDPVISDELEDDEDNWEDISVEGDDENDAIDALTAELEAHLDDHLDVEEDEVAMDIDDNSGATVEADSGRSPAPPEREMRDVAEEDLRQQPFVVRFPGGRAGKPLPGVHDTLHQTYAASVNDSNGTNMYGVFGHQLAWEIARWAKLRGPSSTAFTELMKIDGVVERLDLPFKNSAELNTLVDEHLPGRPSFVKKQISLGGEVFDLYFRDIIECVKALIGDLDFCPVLKFEPEKHYTDNSQSERLYYDMHTGRWWWDTQKKLEARLPGATVVPIILSSDKTQLTLFRNKSAYPLYMTIGNIPKEVRRKPSARAYVLLGYLPTSRLLHIKNAAARRRCLANLFHACLRRIVAPLKAAGLNGEAMTTADGLTRRCHPIYACFIGDYPEQVLVTCTYSGDCAQCTTPNAALGHFDRNLADGQTSRLRNLESLVKVFDSFDNDPGGYLQRCKKHRVRPIIKPFWRDLPYSHAYRAITPDVLHQLYQGVVKHLLSWLKDVLDPAEMDARCQRLPPNHSIRIFMGGISNLSHITGQTHDEICRVLLGLVVDACPQHSQHRDPRIVRCVRAVLDFLYLAQYPIHTNNSLTLMNDALERFHDNKSVFIDLGVRSDFNLPKLHFAQHYLTQIKLFGTTDNFNTQYTERLHIDLAKHAYAATNRKDEFAQMTTWLERREKILQHEQYIAWRCSGSPLPLHDQWSPPGLETRKMLSLPKHPSARATFEALTRDYGTTFIIPSLCRFIAMTNDPSIRSKQQLDYAAANIILPFTSVEVWHRIKFVQQDAWTGVQETVDSVHVYPAHRGRRRRGSHITPARFDTALIDMNNGMARETGCLGYRVGRIRAIFSIPQQHLRHVFLPGVRVARHLAYIEWYTPFSTRADPDNLMYKISPVHIDGGILSSVTPLAHIRRSVHLFPKFGRTAPTEWTSSNVLDLCKTFYVNSFADKHLYRVLY
ncbi:hypothetical protein GGG16DRAFT_59260 [Schizophyllum commune]